MKKAFMKFVLLFAITMGSIVSCSDEEDLTITEDLNAIEKEAITLYLADTKETIEVQSLNEVKTIIKERYNQKNDVVKNALDKIDLLQKELSYSNSLDLNNSEVEKEYSKRITEKYSNNKLYHKSTNGILWDNIASGFLSVTTIPLNLKASKRNRASSWSPISPGTVILCDKKWFKGSKFVLFAIIPGPTAVVASPFNNKADSFF